MRRLLRAAVVSSLLSASVCFPVAGVRDGAAKKPGGMPRLRTRAIKLNVEDMEKALAFYVGKLGFEAEDGSGRPREVVLRTNDRVKLILSKVGKLRKPAPEETQVGLTLQVNDLGEAIARMKSAGVEFAESERRKEGVGDAISIRDPSGRRISLMHQTIVKVDPFKEPKLYNFGFLVPDMSAARNFYAGRLGFVVRSERYLPLDLPLGHADNSFSFMLHYRPGVRPVKSEYPKASAFYTIVFETDDLGGVVEEMKRGGIKIVGKKLPQGGGGTVVFEDPFGNVSELVSAK